MGPIAIDGRNYIMHMHTYASVFIHMHPSCNRKPPYASIPHLNANVKKNTDKFESPKHAKPKNVRRREIRPNLTQYSKSGPKIAD